MAKPRRVSAGQIAFWAAMGVIGVVVGGYMLCLFMPRRFQRFVHFEGAVTRLQPLAADRLFVVERTHMAAGEDGPIVVGDRWRIVDVRSGKTLVGPHINEHGGWIALQGERVVSMLPHQLEVRGLDNALVATLDSFKDIGNPRRDWNYVKPTGDGHVSVMSEDGRYYTLDVNRMTATQGGEKQESGSRYHLGTASVQGQPLVGSPRARVDGKGPDYLDPSWVRDEATNDAIEAAGGHVLLHHTRVHGAEGGRGPMLSAVDAEGKEAWRYVLPEHELWGVVRYGDRLVLAINHDEYGPSLLVALGLGDGKEAWRLAL